MFGSLVCASNRHLVALIAGLALGLGAGLLALLTVVLSPVMAFAALLGVALALLVLTDLHGGLYVTIAVIALLPFGKLPVNFSATPTLLDGALGGFFIVYLFQWMSGQRRLFRSTPVTPLALGFTGLMVFAFVMGLRHTPLDARTLRIAAEMVLSLLLIPVLVDVMRDSVMLRRAVRVLILAGAASALVGIGLWALPDATAEALLNRLGRLQYPMGGVLRYRQTPGALLNERAIGTWIDPNAFGGYLLMTGAVTAPQIFSKRPVLPRWVAAGCLGVVVLALFLTDSRGSMLSLGAACVLIAAVRYRGLLAVMVVVVALAFFLPPTQRYIAKVEAGLANQDVETQMRFGEYKDALILIERHPVIGVGFTGTPEIDLYLGVANTYLTIASSAGLVGLAGYLLLMVSPFAYSLAHYREIQADPALADIWLGLAAGLVGVLAGGVFDHFYFKIDQFQSTMAYVWILFGLLLASIRLAGEQSGPIGQDTRLSIAGTAT